MGAGLAQEERSYLSKQVFSRALIFALEKTSNDSNALGGMQACPRRYGIPMMR